MFLHFKQEKRQGRDLPIKPLTLKQEDVRTYPLYIVHPNPQQIGPSAELLISLFKECSNL